MNLTEAKNLARTLMNQHGLDYVLFEFDGGKKRLGCTLFRGGMPIKISLSRHFVVLLPEDEVRDVILHEIAHAIAGVAAGHGPAWRMVARRVGATPKRCASPSARPDSLYTQECPNGHTFPAHRKPLRVKSCSKCSPVFRFDYRLVLKENGVPVPVSQMPKRYRDELAIQKLKYSV